MDYGTDGKMTLTEAGALTEILRAAQRNAPVVRLDPATGRLVTGQARYIGGEAHGINGPARDFASECSADVRDLFLAVLEDGRGRLLSWPVRELIRQYAVDTFAIDLTRAAMASPSALRHMGELVSEGRRWLADRPSVTAVIEGDIADLTDDDVRMYVEAVYEGGWARFATSGPHPR
jgi:hypothetical protein